MKKTTSDMTLEEPRAAAKAAKKDKRLSALPAKVRDWSKRDIDHLTDCAAMQEMARIASVEGARLSELLAGFDGFPVRVRHGYYEYEIRKTAAGRLESKPVGNYQDECIWVQAAGGKRLIKSTSADFAAI